MTDTPFSTVHFATLGLTRRSAGLDVREKVAIQPYELPQALSRLSASLGEVVLLSTCHRTELYVATTGGAPSRAFLEERLASLRGLPREALTPHTSFLARRQAVEHLFHTACGLDSVILGESQILGQVRAALEAARAARTVGPALDMLFTCALRVGRRARSTTGIARSPASISSAAVDLARRLVDLESSHLVLVGTGRMGELAAKSLVQKGVSRFAVVGRTPARARQLTLQCGDALAVVTLMEALEEADVVITATNAPHPVVTSAMVADVMSRRPRRPLRFIDIAVPRDVEPAAGEIPGVVVYNVDDLRETAGAGLTQRRAEVPRVLDLVQQEADRFEAWCRVQAAAPAVIALRQYLDILRQEVLARRQRQFRDLTPEQWRAVEALTVSVLNKVLHHPTKALCRMAADGSIQAIPHVLEELFSLSLPSSPGRVVADEQPPLSIDTGSCPPAYSGSAQEAPNGTREMCSAVRAARG